MKNIWMRLMKGLLLLAGVAALAGVVMLLWNWIMPGLHAGIQQVDYWHALGLFILSRILFGGFHGHGGWYRHRQWHKWQKLQSMTAEEREQYFQFRRHLFGHREQ